MRGFVYVLTNSSYPHLVKIGKTSRSPEQRADELSGTGVPTPFIVSYSVEVDDMDSFESYLHDHFSDFRYNKDREFFEIQPKLVIDKILETSKLFTVDGSKENLISTVDQKNPLNFYIAVVDKLDNRESVYRYGFTTLCDLTEVKEGIEEYMREVLFGSVNVEIQTFFEVKEKIDIPQRIRLVFSNLFLDEENQLFEADPRTLERLTGYLKSEFWDNDRMFEDALKATQESSRKLSQKSAEEFRRQQLKSKI